MTASTTAQALHPHLSPPVFEWGFGAIWAILLPLGGLALFIFAAVLVSSWLNARRARYAKRLDVLEKALDHPEMDAATRSQVVALLAREHVGRPLGFLARASFWLSASFVVGWLILIVFGLEVLLVRAELLSMSIEVPLVMTAVGLALVTLPIATREFFDRARKEPEVS